MIDIKFLRENPEIVKQNIKNKFQEKKLPLVDEVIELDKQARAAKGEADALRANRNKISKEIGGCYARGEREKAEELKAKVAADGAKLEELEKQEAELNAKVTEIMMVIPNIIDPSVPIGKDDSEYLSGASLTLRRFGSNPFGSMTVTTQTLDTTSPAPTEKFIASGSETGVGSAVNVTGKDNGKQINQPVSGGLLVLSNTFSFNNVAKAQSGSLIPSVKFNADGTPKQINTDKIAIEWANGASDMTGNYYESSQINLYIGDANTANGLTQLSGNFATNYVNQDGAKYGNYTGVSVSKDGIVTAIFDNGETRAIAQIPLATFVDVNSLEALTGNAYIETTSSGNATLRTAGESGAGTIASSSLENSTVDIAEEFTDMITTQRAYSAASKIITTADSMLEELLTIKR